MYTVLLFFNHDVIRVEFNNLKMAILTLYSKVVRFNLYTQFSGEIKVGPYTARYDEQSLYAFSLNHLCHRERDSTRFHPEILYDRFLSTLIRHRNVNTEENLVTHAPVRSLSLLRHPLMLLQTCDSALIHLG
jgi:hypothetical protein